MRYEYSLLARLASLAIFLPFLFYKIFLPLTIYPVFIIFKILGYQSIISSSILVINQQPLMFIEACIAPYAYYLLLALIVLTKDIQLLTRFKMFLLGSLMILLANILRIIILVLVLSSQGINSFYTIHIAFWLLIATVYIAILWIALTKIFKVKSIPVYSDFKYLLQHILL